MKICEICTSPSQNIIGEFFSLSLSLSLCVSFHLLSTIHCAKLWFLCGVFYLKLITIILTTYYTSGYLLWLIVLLCQQKIPNGKKVFNEKFLLSCHCRVRLPKERGSRRENKERKKSACVRACGMSVGPAAGVNRRVDCPAVIDMEMGREEKNFVRVCLRPAVEELNFTGCSKNQRHLASHFPK